MTMESIQQGASLVNKYGKWVGIIAVVGVGLVYVLNQVNPDTIAAYLVQAERQKIFRCIVKEFYRQSEIVDKAKILECAE